jgi:hypothetical protein
MAGVVIVLPLLSVSMRGVHGADGAIDIKTVFPNLCPRKSRSDDRCWTRPNRRLRSDRKC